MRTKNGGRGAVNPSPREPGLVNPTGLRNRVEEVQKRACTLRGRAQALASDTAALAQDCESLVEDLKKVGL